MRVNDVFPTESGEGGRVVDIQSEELVLETKNGRTNLAFWKMCSRTSGRLRNRGGMDPLQIHPATATRHLSRSLARSRLTTHVRHHRDSSQPQ